MPATRTAGRATCPTATRVGALLDRLTRAGWGRAEALAEALALLRVLRPGPPLPALRDEAERIARQVGWPAAEALADSDNGARR